MLRPIVLVLGLLAPVLLAAPAASLGVGGCVGLGQVVELSANGNVYYVENRLGVDPRAGVWLYQESNRVNWLQEGGALPGGLAGDPCPTPEGLLPDRLLF